MGIASLLVAAVTHPNEARAMINYSIWRDPLRRIEDNTADSGWYVLPSRAGPSRS